MGGVRGIVVFLGRELYCVVWVCVSDGRTDGRTDRETERRLLLLPSFGGSSIIKEVDG